MLMDFMVGFMYVVRSFRLIIKPGLKRYVIIPVLINTILFIGVIYALVRFFDDLMQRSIPHGLNWLNWLLWPLIAIGAAIAVFYTFSLVANLIAAPFTGLLAEKIEEQLGGRPPSAEANFWWNLRNGWIAIKAQLATLRHLLLWAIPLMLFSLIPGIGFLLAPLWLIFSAWMQALGYLSIPMGNHGLNFPQIRELASRYRAASLGMGMGITLLTSLPVINFFALPIGTAAATLLSVNYSQKVYPSKS